MIYKIIQNVDKDGDGEVQFPVEYNLNLPRKTIYNPYITTWMVKMD